MPNVKKEFSIYAPDNSLELFKIEGDGDKYIHATTNLGKTK